MTTIAEYAQVAAELEAAPPSEDAFLVAGINRLQVKNALWQPWCRADARELVLRFQAIEDRSAVAAGCASPGWNDPE